MTLLMIAMTMTSLVTFWVIIDTRYINALEILFVDRNIYFIRNWRAEWRLLLTYSWRLFLLFASIVLGLLTLLWFAIENPLELGLGVRFLLTFVLATYALLPLFILSPSYRYHKFRKACSLADEITPFAENFSCLMEMAQVLDPADTESYDRRNDWTAWQAKKNDWDDRENNIWKGDLFPIVFANHQSPRSLIFARQLDKFMIWNPSLNEYATGVVLPFNYLGCNFRIRRVFSQQVPKKWMIVEAEMVLKSETDD